MRVRLRLPLSGGRLVGGDAVVYRDDGPKIYNESTFWYAVKKNLQEQGYDVIKKLMVKDGHLTNDNVYYVRSRKYTPKGFLLWDSSYAIRSVCEPYNRDGQVALSVTPALSQEGIARFFEQKGEG